jgi:hypothetical protein
MENKHLEVTVKLVETSSGTVLNEDSYKCNTFLSVSDLLDKSSSGHFQGKTLVLGEKSNPELLAILLENLEKSVFDSNPLTAGIKELGVQGFLEVLLGSSEDSDSDCETCDKREQCTEIKEMLKSPTSEVVM